MATHMLALAPAAIFAVAWVLVCGVGTGLKNRLASLGLYRMVRR